MFKGAILRFMQWWAVHAPVAFISRVYLRPQVAPETLLSALENPRIELPDLSLSLALREGKQGELVATFLLA